MDSATERVRRAACGLGFLGVVALCGAALLAGPEPGSWLRLDGSSGAVSAVAVSPSAPGRVYAATADGVFRSEDGGVTWRRWRSGFGFSLVNCLAVAGEPSEVIYAGTAGGGVFRSDDLGDTWRAASNGAEGTIRALQTNPSDASDAYAIASRVVRTQQGGAYWYSSDTGLGPEVLALAVAPSDRAILYAVANFSFRDDPGPPVPTVFRSDNGGGTWTLDSPQNPLALAGDEAVLAIDSADSRVVYAGAENGLFRRSVAGTWSLVTLRPGTPPTVRGVSIAPADPSILYVAIDGAFFRSADGGATWSEAAAPGGPLNRVHGLRVSTGSSATVFAATRFGLFRSRDGGGSWRLMDQGLPPASGLGLAFDPANPLHVFLNSNRGLIESAVGGRVWEEPIAELADYQRSNRFPKISRVWSPPFAGQAEVFVDPSNPRRILVASNGLHLSEDGGRSFSRRFAEEVGSLAFSSAAPGVLLAATVGSGVLKSVDGGVNWEASAEGLPFDDFGGPGSPRTIFTVVFDPRDPSIAYAGGRFGVHKSVDGGAHWSESICCPFQPESAGPALIVPDTANVVSLAIDPANPSTIYAGANPLGEYRRRLYKTTDGGQTWQASDQGLPPRARVLVAVDSRNPSHVYAGTWGFGVYRSVDGGAHWLPMNEGLENLFVKSIAFDFGGRLHVGTEGGLYRFQSDPPMEPAPVRPIQTVSGNLYPSGEVELAIGLFRTSPNSTVPVQTTFVEALPEGLTLVEAEADRGTVVLGPSLRTVTWTGSLAHPNSAQIRVRARIDEGTAGRTLLAQGIAFLSNGAFSLSGGQQSPGQPTIFEIGEPPLGGDAFFVPVEIPVAGSFVGVAAANLGDSAASPRLEVRSAGGALVSSTDLTILPSLGQTALVAGVAAGGGDSLLVRGVEGRLDGFFLIGDQALDRLDGVGGGLPDAQTLIFPFGGSASGGEILVSLFNPDGEAAANAVLRLIDGQGGVAGEATLELAPLGTRTASLRELFGRSGLADGYLRLEADRPVRGFELEVADRSFSAAPARAAVWTERLRSPHFFFGPDGSTRVRVVNPLPTAARLRFRIIDDLRGVLAEPTVEVGPGGVGEFDLRTLAGVAPGEARQGWLEILADGGDAEGVPLEAALVAVSVYEAAGGELRSNLPLSTVGTTEVAFLQVAQSQALGLFQGLAVVAPTGADVDLSVFDEQGRRTAQRRMTLQAGERLVGLLNEPAVFGPDFQQSGGILRVEASRPVVAYSLFGGARFLAAVEGR